MENTTVEQPSSIFPNNEFEPVKKEYATASTGLIIFFLIIVFFVLKAFIYVPDEKRKGK